MDAIMQQLDINTLIQLVTVLILLVSLRWRLPSKDDIKRLDDRIDQTNTDMKAGFTRVEERFAEQDAKFEARFAEQDAKLDDFRKDVNAEFQRVDERFEQQRIEFKADIGRVDAKLDDFRKDVKTDFQQVDERFEQQRIEFKADLHRVEDRAAEANEYHAKSVTLLDGILRQLQERREPL